MNPIEVTWKLDVAGAGKLEKLLITNVYPERRRASGRVGGAGHTYRL